MLNARQFHALVEHASKLLMTNDRQFAHMHITSGSVLDFVPKGSFAYEMEPLSRGKKKRCWRFVPPDLIECWKRFQRALEGRILY